MANPIETIIAGMSEAERDALIALDMFELRQMVCKAAPDLDPPPAHWLYSGAGPGYCEKCVVMARGMEFELGRPIVDTPFHRRDEWEDAFWDGIEREAYRQAGQYDISEVCYTCGITLAYWLTDEGINSELDFWERHLGEGGEFGDLSEAAYAIDRLFECGDDDVATVRALAVKFLEHVSQTSLAVRDALRKRGK